MSGFLLDTSFLITLVNPERSHHETAKSYYREALLRAAPLYLSTIVASEFQVGQPLQTLPLHQFIVLPFNFDHAVMAGDFYNALVQIGRDWEGQRGAVKDDVKLLAQAECSAIPYLLTADEQTLCKYARRLSDAGHSNVRPVVMSTGFDVAWFQEGQRSLPEA
jgi:predicted nucleic acid-binding protein